MTEGKIVQRFGNTNKLYRLVVDGVDVGQVKRRYGMYKGWYSAGRVWLTKEGAERALINRAAMEKTRDAYWREYLSN